MVKLCNGKNKQGNLCASYGPYDCKYCEKNYCKRHIDKHDCNKDGT